MEVVAENSQAHSEYSQAAKFDLVIEHILLSMVIMPMCDEQINFEATLVSDIKANGMSQMVIRTSDAHRAVLVRSFYLQLYPRADLSEELNQRLGYFESGRHVISHP